MMWSAFILGLLGSIHCLAMCGPLVLALNSKKRQSGQDKLYYNSGRIFTYAILGSLAGLFGSSIKWAAGQQTLSILSGVLLIVGLTISWLGSSSYNNLLPRLFARIKSQMSKVLTAGSGNMWWFGVYNGLLPCGLTYVALAAAISTGNLRDAIIYMAIFGVGTSPMMWVIVSGFQQLNFKWIKGKRLVTGFTWILAILLIIRGLGLGIPFLSPDVDNQHEHHMLIGK